MKLGNWIELLTQFYGAWVIVYMFFSMGVDITDTIFMRHNLDFLVVRKLCENYLKLYPFYGDAKVVLDVLVAN